MIGMKGQENKVVSPTVISLVGNDTWGVVYASTSKYIHIHPNIYLFMLLPQIQDTKQAIISSAEIFSTLVGLIVVILSLYRLPFNLNLGLWLMVIGRCQVLSMVSL